MLKTGDDFGKRICQIIGVENEYVESISIHIDTGEPIVVVVTMFLDEDRANEIEKEIDGLVKNA